jgi:hypothetical protein
LGCLKGRHPKKRFKLTGPPGIVGSNPAVSDFSSRKIDVQERIVVLEHSVFFYMLARTRHRVLVHELCSCCPIVRSVQQNVETFCGPQIDASICRSNNRVTVLVKLPLATWPPKTLCVLDVVDASTKDIAYRLADVCSALPGPFSNPASSI